MRRKRLIRPTGFAVYRRPDKRRASGASPNAACPPYPAYRFRCLP
ncbi:hypothetical protein CIT292_09789 [Citrobacter youngae ATCC 29220]|uniref:Uncharacterized protein n=1 Tax=Citrobacter youngae ATCC 29220 TaxID=500640 RepID=D4BGY2_9ENTR|nr:hypothetical protein CIT292_09789 [Citrobacter youngae ATCC 29220]